MKRIFFTFTMAMLAILSFAQIPQAFSYQAVIRDAENNLVVSQPIFLELSVLQGSDDGEVVYSEKHVVSTNSNGLISLEMGAGVSRDDFSAIDWSNAPYFVKTVFEFDGKQISGVTPLLSVPYALYAEKAGSADIDLSDYALKNDIPTDYVTSSTLDGYIKKSDIDLSDYALKNEIPTDYVTNSTLNDYAKKTDIPLVDLSGYYSKADVDALLAEMNAKIKKIDKELHPIVGGAIVYSFSVSVSKQIYFSQGNLQYQASTGTWKFADNQYDMIGADNANISETYEGWIDLFGWGTSGWNSGANAYQPYSTSTNIKDYFTKNDLTGDYANADWGVYNAVVNGGNQTGLWRTLTGEEWGYLISTRTDASSKKALASIDGINGLVLLPDNWTLPDGLAFNSGISDYEQNAYSATEWVKMERNGAVFLPAAGYRSDTVARDWNSQGEYWSSSAIQCLRIPICMRYEFSSSFIFATYGRPVRLVQDVK